MSVAVELDELQMIDRKANEEWWRYFSICGVGKGE